MKEELIRAAYLYYIQKLNQQEIAEKMAMSRQRVGRLLRRADLQRACRGHRARRGERGGLHHRDAPPDQRDLPHDGAHDPRDLRAGQRKSALPQGRQRKAGRLHAGQRQRRGTVKKHRPKKGKDKEVCFHFNFEQRYRLESARGFQIRLFPLFLSPKTISAV